jgi:hypothetical protein
MTRSVNLGLTMLWARARRNEEIRVPITRSGAAAMGGYPPPAPLLHIGVQE